MAKKAKRKKAPAKPRTNRTRRTSTPDWGPAFLTELRARGSILAACAAAAVGRSTVYERRDTDGPFAADMAEALEIATDSLELEARRRAVDGVERPVFGSGGPGVGTVQVGVVREYSDSLMALLLKAHMPARYRENVKVEHGGKIGVEHSASDLSDDELAEIAKGD